MSNADKIITKLHEGKPEPQNLEEGSSKPLTFKEVVKNNKGKEDVVIRELVSIILASTNAMRIFTEVAKVLKSSMKDTDAIGHDATGQEVSKGAIKEAFRKFLGL